MSLQVWLPLTKDTRNQGLATGTINWTTTASFTNNGKLGKALTTGGCKMPASMTAQVLNNQAVTIACWLFVNADADDSTNRAMIFGNDSMSTLGGRQFSIFRYPNSDDIHLSWQNCINGTYSSTVGGLWSGVLTPHAWNHICVTYDNPTAKIYVNGVQIGTASGNMNTDSYNFDTQLIYNSTSHYINDFRIYNHCLSPMEVKELAKGLVLHYPLNRQGWGQENLLKNSNFLQGTNGMQGYTATSATCTKQTDCMKVISTSASGGFYSSNFDSITTGVMTIFSADVKADSNMTIYIGTDGSGNGSCQAYTVGTSWQRISISKAKTTNNANLRIYGNGIFYAKNLKYELGSIATPWCPNSSDVLATTMGLNSTTEYDCSGFCNNGTRIGTFTWTSDTPKYQVSTYNVVNGTRSMIETVFPPEWLNSTQIFTANMWIKVNSLIGSDWNTIFRYAGSNAVDKQLHLCYKNGLINMSRYSDDPTYSYTIPLNTWTMITWVESGRNGWLYINGNLKSTFTHAGDLSIVSSAKLWLFKDGLRNGSYDGDLSISDFRIYATALSASDVKSLYQNCATIDPDGTIRGQIRS